MDKKTKPTNPRPQISMLHKALYSFLCVRVWLFRPPAPSAQPRGNIEIWGCGGDNNTAGVWFHRPSMVRIHECLFCWLCYFWFWLLPLSGSSPQNPKVPKDTFLTSPGTLITATAAALASARTDKVNQIHQNLWYCPREGIARCQNLLESPCTRKWVIEPTAKSRELMMAGRPWKKLGLLGYFW